jgi:thiol-disulfide isomerase/thioredoxin
MKLRTLFVLILLQAYSNNEGMAQRRFSVTIQLPSKLFDDKVRVILDDGKTHEKVHPVFKNGQMTLTGELYARYATLEFYKDSHDRHFPFYNLFFVDDRPASIRFLPADTAKNPFLHFRVVNAYQSDEMGEKKLKSFDSLEEGDFTHYATENDKKLAYDSVTMQTANEKFIKLCNKKLEFIKANRNLYFSFWLFRTQLVWVSFLRADSLLTFYNNIFPERFTKTMEGGEIVKLLKGRTLSKNSGLLAPDFTASDINGQMISLHDFRGKFVLLDFWASWCSPCMQDMSTIKELRAKYSDDKLVIISSNYDRDSSIFIRTVEKNQLNWIHIFRNEDLSKIYGGTGSLPMMFLIDKSGKIIYSIDEEQDYHLILLK